MTKARRLLVYAFVFGVLTGTATLAVPQATLAASHHRADAPSSQHGMFSSGAEEPFSVPKVGDHNGSGAAETGMVAEATASEGGEAHKAGLPQLDPAYFPEQIFWLLISFAAMYLLMDKLALPGVKTTQEARRKTVRRDLAEAKAASEAARAAQALSDKALDEARAKALLAVSDLKSSAEKESSERQSALQRDLTQRIREAESGIAKARAEALREVHNKAAGQIAAEIVEKISGLSLDPSRLALFVAEDRKG